MEPNTLTTSEETLTMELNNEHVDATIPTLPIYRFLDQQLFERKVLELLEEHKTNKPAGIFF
jgi:hypothetical protein